MDYSTFKSLQILLFWGSAIAFCIWQLRAVQRMRRQRLTVKHDEALRRGTLPRSRASAAKRSSNPPDLSLIRRDEA